MPRLARLTFLIASLCVCVTTPVVLQAQEPDGEPPAHISVVDGTALLERDGRSEAAPLSMPLLAGDRVRTQTGRVEILFADGSTLHLDFNTVVDFQSDEVVRLLNGRVRVNIVGASRTVGYRVDAPAAWVQITRPGEYRVALSTDEIELAVLRGAAELVNEDGRTPLGAGERAFARAGAPPSSAYVFNSAAWDSFDRWSEERRDSRLGVNAQYLPDTVQSYSATFAQYGY
jgi:FecR protein